MKAKLYILLFLISSFVMQVQAASDLSYCVVGNASSTVGNGGMAFCPSATRSSSQTLYLKSEIGMTGAISKLSYKLQNTDREIYVSVKIYIGETTNTTLTKSTLLTSSQMSLVYDGSIKTGSNAYSWEDIVLQTPYKYTGTKNLVIAISTSKSSTSTTNAYGYFSSTSRCFSTTASNDPFSGMLIEKSMSPTIRLVFAHQCNYLNGICTRCEDEPATFSQSVFLTDDKPYLRKLGKATVATGSVLAYDRTFSASSVNKWQPLYIPIKVKYDAGFAAKFDLAEIQSFGRVNDTNHDGSVDEKDERILALTYVKLNDYLMPNAPYLIRPKQACTFRFVSADNVLYTANTASMHFETMKEDFEIVGNYDNLSLNSSSMRMADEELVKVSGTVALNPYRWYAKARYKNGAAWDQSVVRVNAHRFGLTQLVDNESNPYTQGYKDVADNFEYMRDFVSSQKYLWQAMYVPFDYIVEKSGDNVYPKFAAIQSIKTENGTDYIDIKMYKAGEVIPANTPTLICMSAAGKLTYASTFVGLYPATGVDPLVFNTNLAKYTFTGVYSPYQNASSWYTLSKQNGALQAAASGEQLPPYRFYMTVEPKSGSANVPFVIRDAHKVIYKVDGKNYKTADCYYGTTIALIDNPTKEGHTFSGWSNVPSTMPAKDVTVTGSFSVNSYKLIYKVDGKEYKTTTVTYGSTITPEAAPTKEGHTFSGWSNVPSTMPAKDVTVTGSFSVNSYKLIYKVDGKEYKTTTVTYGSTITPEAAPTKEGHTFSGWSNVPSTMPAKDVTVTGSFSVNSYKLIYKVDGKEYKTTTVTYGSTITPEAAPTKEGHTFSGWSNVPSTMPAKDVTVTGSFSVNSYKLIYKVDGKEYKTTTVTYGSTITPEAAPTKEGHTFSGWSNVPSTMPDKDVTVTGSFSVNSYKLIYKVDGKEYKTTTVTYGSTITPEAAPTKEGHTFSGWSNVPSTMPAKDVTVTGSFSVNSYKLIYKVDGKEYKTTTVTYGSTITPEAAPTKEGHTFSGWSNVPSTMPAKDVTVTGSFSVNSYKLIYKVDGKEYKTTTVTYGSTITPEAAPTKEGYTFSGWSNVPSTMPAKDVTVTGTFKVNSYKLIYKVDGEVYKTVTVTYGSTITPEPEPTKEGYTFSGWSAIPATMPAEDVTVTGTFSITVGLEHIYVEEEAEVYYDLQGRKVQHLRKGQTYLLNGKRVMYK